MNSLTFDYTDKAFYEAVWDLLAREVGAKSDPLDTEMFILDLRFDETWMEILK